MVRGYFSSFGASPSGSRRSHENREKLFPRSGSATDPAAQWDRLTAKARAIAVPVTGAERAEAMIEAVTGLEVAPDVVGLMRLLA